MKILKVVGAGIGIFIVTGLLLACITGPLYTVVCKGYGAVLGYDTNYPKCYWRTKQYG